MTKHILVFDSGLGGTTILRELQQLMPEHIYSYALDNAAFPYGNKSNAFLQQRIVTLFEQLITQAKPDIVIIACNTASTLILDTLRQRFDMPFVGVVPAIKPAAQISRTKVLGLLATEATVGRDYIDQLEEAHAAHCELIRIPCQSLVTLAEQRILGEAMDTQALNQAVAAIKQHPAAKQIDTFILGCTHFPALKEVLAEHWPTDVHWIDSGAAIARRAQSLCDNLPDTTETPQNACLYITADQGMDKIRQALAGFDIQQSTHIVMR